MGITSLQFSILGIVRYKPEDEFGNAAGEHGVMLEGKHNLDLLRDAGSVRTGELWFDFKSIDSLTMLLHKLYNQTYSWSLKLILSYLSLSSDPFIDEKPPL